MTTLLDNEVNIDAGDEDAVPLTKNQMNQFLQKEDVTQREIDLFNWTLNRNDLNEPEKSSFAKYREYSAAIRAESRSLKKNGYGEGYFFDDVNDVEA